jgi:hypothetical protein
MKVFWFFFSKKNRKRFFLQKAAKTIIPRLTLIIRPTQPRWGETAIGRASASWRRQATTTT